MKKRKILASLVALLGVLSLVHAAAAAAGYDDASPARWRNFLGNPSFESCSWWGCGGSTASWSPMNAGHAVNLRTGNVGGAKYGSYFGQLSTWEAGGSVAQDFRTTITSGTRYRFEMWVRDVDTSNSWNQPPVRGTLALWALGGSVESATSSFNAYGSWTLVATELVMTSAHSTLRAEVYLESTDKALALDGAQLIRTGLDYGSFEGGGGTWRPLNGSAAVNFTQYQGWAREGEWYAEMNTTESGASVAQDVYPSTKLGWGVPGTNQRTYCFSAWLRTPHGTFSGALALWTLGGGPQEMAYTPFTVGPEWVRFNACLAAGYNHDGLRAEIYMYSTVSASAPDVHLDVDATRLGSNLP